MNSVYGFELIVIFLLLIANGLFAMSETAIISAKKVRLQQWANEGNKKAARALDLANSPNRFLSTVQIGITLVGIISGAFGGKTIAKMLERDVFSHVEFLEKYAEHLSFFTVVFFITYLSVIVGELVPKRFALQNAERIAVAVAGPMAFVSKIASPVVYIFSVSTDIALKVFGLSHKDDEPPITQEEIKTLVEQGTQAGVFERSEQAIMERVLDFSEKKLTAIMTPRPDIVWLDANDDTEKNREKMRDAPHSNFPVAKDNLDNLLGTIRIKDLYCKVSTTETIDLRQYLYQPLFIPESTNAMLVLERFKETGIHIAFVIDEYGVIQGLVTLDDILTAIIGDIPSQDNPLEKQAHQREDGSWLIDGMMPVDAFKELFKLSALPREDVAHFQTLAGFILSRLGKIPTESDSFTWNGFKFEVMDMDGNRIDKVLVEPPPIGHNISDNEPKD